jgi:hypothetical protein
MFIQYNGHYLDGGIDYVGVHILRLMVMQKDFLQSQYTPGKRQRSLLR